MHRAILIIMINTIIIAKFSLQRTVQATECGRKPWLNNQNLAKDTNVPYRVCRCMSNVKPLNSTSEFIGYLFRKICFNDI
jgi:hypothetical protein